jgi:uncharacterized membrane protein SirB2
MTLVEAYSVIKPLHVMLVAASGALFAVRGAAVLLGRGWPMRPAWRRSSVVIDTLLLAAGATLWAMLSLHPARQTWLGAKLALLLVYIALGSMALKRAPSRRARAACYAAALLVFAWMVSIARAHQPLGALAALLPP